MFHIAMIKIKTDVPPSTTVPKISISTICRWKAKGDQYSFCSCPNYLPCKCPPSWDRI